MFRSFNSQRGQDTLFPLLSFIVECEATLSTLPLYWQRVVLSLLETSECLHGVQHVTWCTVILGGKNYIEIEFLDCAGPLKWKQGDLSTIRWSIDHCVLMRNTVYLFSTWSCTWVFRGFTRVSVVLCAVWPYSHFSKHPSGPRIYPCFSLIWLRVSVSVRKYPDFRGIYHWSPLPLTPTHVHTVTRSNSRRLFWLSDRLTGKTFFSFVFF